MTATPLSFSPVTRNNNDDDMNSFYQPPVSPQPNPVYGHHQQQQQHQHVNDSRGVFSPTRSLNQFNMASTNDQPNSNNSNNYNINSRSSFKDQFYEIRQTRLLRQGKDPNGNALTPTPNELKQRQSSPIRDRANLTTGTLNSTLADIDRRTRRTESYIIKKYENVERRNEATRHHRVAKDVPSYSPVPTGYQQQQQQQQQNASSKQKVIETGNRIRDIQEEITRRRLQSEATVMKPRQQSEEGVSSSISAANKVASIQEMLRKNINLDHQQSSHHHQSSATNGARVLGYDFGTHNSNNSDAEDFNDPNQQAAASGEEATNTNALRKRLEDARRSTAASVSILFSTAINALNKREKEGRSSISAEQTQQFARMTALEALKYAQIISPAGNVDVVMKNRSIDDNRADNRSELENFLEIEEQSRQPHHQYQQQEQQQQHNQSNQQQQQEGQSSESMMMHSPGNQTAVHYPTHHLDDSSSSAQQLSPSSQKQSARSRSGSAGSERQTEELHLLRLLYVFEAFEKSEIRSRQALTEEAFNQQLRIALRMSSPSSSSFAPTMTAGNYASTNKTRHLPPQTDDNSVISDLKNQKKILIQMFSIENATRREFELRQKIVSEAFDAQVFIFAQFFHSTPNKNNNQRPSSSSPRSARNNNDNSNTRSIKQQHNRDEDQNSLRQLFVAETLQHREARARISILMDCLQPTAAFMSSFSSTEQQQKLPDVLLRSSNNDNNNNNNNNNNDSDDDDKGTMRTLFLVQHLEHRESKKRQEVLLDALQDITSLFSELGFFVTNNDRTSTTGAATNRHHEQNLSSGRNGNQRSSSSRPPSSGREQRQKNDSVLLRNMFIMENLEHKESTGRHNVLLQAMSDIFILFNQHSNEVVLMNNSNSNQYQHSTNEATTPKGTRIVEVPKIISSSESTSAELHSAIMIETVILRESEERNALESNFWREFLILQRFNERYLVLSLAAANDAISNLEDEQEEQQQSNGNNNNNRTSSSTKSDENDKRYSAEDMQVTRSLFIFENLKRGEVERRAHIAEEAFLFFANSSGWKIPSEIASSFSPSRTRALSSSNNNNNNNASTTEASEEIDTLRNMFLLENLTRREADARASIQTNALSSKLELVYFMMMDQKQQNLSPSRLIQHLQKQQHQRPNSAPNATGSFEAKNTKLVRDLFTAENLFRREMDIRTVMLEDEASLRYHMILAFYASVTALLRVTATTASSTSPVRSSPASSRRLGATSPSSSASPSRPLSAASQKADSQLLRELFIFDNFEKRQGECRYAIEQTQFMERLELSSKLQCEMMAVMKSSSSASSSSNNNDSTSNKLAEAEKIFSEERQTLSRLFVIENLRHRESNVRSAVSEEHLTELVVLQHVMAHEAREILLSGGKDQKHSTNLGDEL